MSSDIAYQSAAELLANLRAGHLSAVEALDALTGRCAERNPEINVVVTTDLERARERARAIDEARARGEALGPLAGLPMTVKDSLMTEGVLTTSGAPELADFVPDRDAAAVARLKAAGAVVWGKTNLPIYAGDAQSYNEVFGTSNNPWDTSRSPAAARAARPGPWPPASPRSRWAATSAAASASRQPCAAPWATSRATASCRPRARSRARPAR